MNSSDDYSSCSTCSDSDGEPIEKRTKTCSLTQFKSNILNVLTKVVAGEFSLSGKLENAPLVAIKIATEDSLIKFPVDKRDVERIVDSFATSPCGKGSETLVDTSIRNSLQLCPDQFQIKNPDWDKYMEHVVKPRVMNEMLLEHSFVASLHKLLLYTPGSFFKPHRDSEKVEGMFATLVIQLPSTYEGGQLIVRHAGKMNLIDFSSSQSTSHSFSTFFSVFYCDCEHEIRPVTDGYRVCLIYNLIAQKVDAIPVAPRNLELEMELTKLIENWETPQKLVYALKHLYSQTSLTLDNLKTTDKVVLNMMKHISETSDLVVYLATFNKEVAGEGDGNEDDCIGCTNSECQCRCCDVDFDSEYDEFMSTHYELVNFVTVVGSETLIPPLKVNFRREVIPDDCFDSIEPSKRTCSHTGNEGVKLEKQYRSAAVVFWPKKFMSKILEEHTK